MLIFAIGISSLLIIFTAASRTSKMSSDKTAAYTFADQKLSELALRCEQTDSVPDGKSELQSVENDPDYLWQYSVSTSTVLTLSSMRLITLGVYWPAALPEEQRQRILLTTIARKIYEIS